MDKKWKAVERNGMHRIFDENGNELYAWVDPGIAERIVDAHNRAVKRDEKTEYTKRGMRVLEEIDIKLGDIKEMLSEDPEPNILDQEWHVGEHRDYIFDHNGEQIAGIVKDKFGDAIAALPNLCRVLAMVDCLSKVPMATSDEEGYFRIFITVSQCDEIKNALKKGGINK